MRNYTRIVQPLLEIFELCTENSTSKDATEVSEGTEFIGISHIVPEAGLVVLFLVGAITISIQLWILETNFRRELNSLFVVLRLLCIADLLNGVVTLIQTLLSVIEWKLHPGNKILLCLLEIISISGNKYMFSVSAVLLNCLMLLKMIIVTRNCWYTRATVGKICKCIWVVALIISSTEYGISKSELISSESKVVLRSLGTALHISILHFPVLLFRKNILQNKNRKQ